MPGMLYYSLLLLNTKYRRYDHQYNYYRRDNEYLSAHHLHQTDEN